MQPSLPQSVAVLLPFFSATVAGWLSHDRLSTGANAAIALFAIIATAVGCFFLAGNFTGNLAASVSLVLLYIGVLMQGQLAALQKFLVTAPSPLMGNAAPGTSASKVAAQPPQLGG